MKKQIIIDLYKEGFNLNYNGKINMKEVILGISILFEQLDDRSKEAMFLGMKELLGK